jgi:predicted DNA-binding transcriptional regulator YafY
MMLQTKGQVTAAEVAAELEVSERTARRDLDALGVAGLPVYSLQGRNGGWRLAGGGRTDLSGLTASETQALFLLAGPRATTPELRAALRKLVRAMPEPFREHAEAASTAVVHDPSGWGGLRSDRPVPEHLDTLQTAVITGRQVTLGYRARAGEASTRRVHPLGLATKSGSWYLIADTGAGQRTFRVDRVQSVEVSDDPVVRPEGFELSDAWQMITTEVERVRTPVVVRALIDPRALSWVRHVFGARLRIAMAIDDGRIEVDVRSHGEFSVAAELAGFGTMVEVVEPPGVRQRLAELAAELRRRGGVGEFGHRGEAPRRFDLAGRRCRGAGATFVVAAVNPRRWQPECRSWFVIVEQAFGDVQQPPPVDAETFEFGEQPHEVAEVRFVRADIIGSDDGVEGHAESFIAGGERRPVDVADDDQLELLGQLL